ncbi:epididymal secretory glutathione peroxidase-like, partial [Paramuricea clavata]
YQQLNALVTEFNTTRCPLKVFGVPCNQFGLQEPGQGIEIVKSLQYVRPGNGFKPNFDLLVKRDVNGEKEDALFTWLKSQCPNPTTLIGDPSKRFYSPIRTTDIKWNFEKFLIDHTGQPRKRYTPNLKPQDMKTDIQNLVQECLKGKQHRVMFQDVFDEV